MQMLILFKEQIEIQWNGIMHVMQKFTTIEHRNQMKQNNAYDAKFKIHSNNKRPYEISKVDNNGTVKIKIGSITDTFNIRNITPDYE